MSASDTRGKDPSDSDEMTDDSAFRLAFAVGVQASASSSSQPPQWRQYDPDAFVVIDEAVRLAKDACVKARSNLQAQAIEAPIPPDRDAFEAAQIPKAMQRIKQEREKKGEADLTEEGLEEEARQLVARAFAGAMKKYQGDLGKYQKAVALQNSPEEQVRRARNIIFQSLGDAFEEMVWPQVRLLGSGGTVFHGLSLGATNELDFVIIQPGSVEIISAKLDPRQFDKPTDLGHWRDITARWAEKMYTRIEGPDVMLAPTDEPTVTNISLRDFGMTSDQFLDMVMPDWRERVGLQ